LNCAGRKSADLTIQGSPQFETFRKSSNAGLQEGIGKMIQTAKEAQIFAAGEARVKAQVRPGVIAELTANRRGIACGIKSGDGGGPACRKQERGKDAEQGGLPGAIGAEKRHGFPRFNLKGNTAEGRESGSGKRL
jgi:hypothetical protein